MAQLRVFHVPMTGGEVNHRFLPVKQDTHIVGPNMLIAHVLLGQESADFLMIVSLVIESLN